jgi:AAHS family 4-hydroxybenzoate transporter-like MFS transporter
VLAIYCGFSLGFVAAGLVAGAFLGRFGWQSVLLVGALIPIAIAPIALRLLPRESATAAPDRAPGGRRVSVVELFTPERMPGTLLLWFAFLVNLGEFYFIQSWLPTILTAQSAPVGTIVTATTLSTVGGIVAAFAMGPAMDRLGAYRSVAVIFLFACAAVAGTGLTFDAGLVPLLIATFALGFFVSGGQKSVIALCALHYPADVRSAGVGWALGIGRIGGIGGPLLAGALFARHWAAGPVFYVASIPLLAAAGALFALERRSIHRVSDSSAAVAPIGAQKARAE